MPWAWQDHGHFLFADRREQGVDLVRAHQHRAVADLHDVQLTRVEWPQENPFVGTGFEFILLAVVHKPIAKQFPLHGLMDRLLQHFDTGEDRSATLAGKLFPQSSGGDDGGRLGPQRRPAVIEQRRIELLVELAPVQQCLFRLLQHRLTGRNVAQFKGLVRPRTRGQNDGVVGPAHVVFGVVLGPGGSIADGLLLNLGEALHQAGVAQHAIGSQPVHGPVYRPRDVLRVRGQVEHHVAVHAQFLAVVLGDLIYHSSRFTGDFAFRDGQSRGQDHQL